MADTEFNAKIVLTADTAKAKKKIADDLSTHDVGGASGVAGVAAATAASTASRIASHAASVSAAAATATANAVKQTQQAVGGGKGAAGGGLLGNITQTMNQIKGIFGIAGNNTPPGLGLNPTFAMRAGLATRTALRNFGASAGVARGVGGAVAGIGGAISAAGPYAIAAGVAVAAIVGVGVALKTITEKVLAFGRSLAKVSGSMAQAFAVFDVQIMQMKRQIGEALAPAFRQLLGEIAEAARAVLPAFTMILKVVVDQLTNLVEGINQFIRAIQVSSRITFDAAAIVADPLNAGGYLDDIANTLKAWWNWEKRRNLKDNQQPSGIMDYMKMLNQEGSAQRQYRDAHAPPRPQVQHALPVAPPRVPEIQ